MKNKYLSGIFKLIDQQLVLSLCVYTAFFAAYLGSSIPSLLLAFGLTLYRLGDLNLSIGQKLILTAVGCYFMLVFFLALNEIVFLRDFRFFFGFIFYLLLLNIYDIGDILHVQLFRVIACSVIVEAVLINTLIDPVWMPNFPDASLVGVSGEFARLMGWYHRPIAFAGNVSMSSTILIALYCLSVVLRPESIERKDVTLLSVAIFCMMSGTGFILYFLVMTVCFYRHNLRAVFLGVLVLGSFFLLGYVADLSRMSANYYEQVILLKVSNVLDLWRSGVPLSVFLFGDQIYMGVEETSSDFGWFILMKVCGFFGLLLYVICLMSFKWKKVFLLPMSILLLGALHYPGLFTSAGQMLFAYMLIGHRGKLG